jgi:hypothetical protein
MKADKNSSQRTNSAYDPNSQPRILTRTCQRRVVTIDIPTPGTSPNTTQRGSKTQEVKDLGKSVSIGRTVWPDVVTIRQAPADSSTPLDGRSVLTDRTSSSYPRKYGWFDCRCFRPANLPRGTQGSRLCGGDRDQKTELDSMRKNTGHKIYTGSGCQGGKPYVLFGDQVWRPALGVGWDQVPG